MKQNNEDREWLDRELSKRKDRKWLRYSSQIARRILAVLRERNEITQKELGSMVGVTPQYISKVLKGQENLTLETISKISEALGVELISFPQYRYSSLPASPDIRNAEFAVKSVVYENISARAENANDQPFLAVIRGALAKAENPVYLNEAV